MNERISVMAVNEGVRMRANDITSYAVRNRKRSISVRVRQQASVFRNVVDHIPLVRGVARVFESIFDCFRGLTVSGELEPINFLHPSASQKRLAHLLGTKSVNIAAVGNGILILFIFLLMTIGIPAALQIGLYGLADLPRYAVNAVCCMFRVFGTLMAIYISARLKITRRFCMYRGAACKVLNAYQAYGDNVTYEEAVLSSRLSDASDGAFMVLILAISMIVFACVRIDNLLISVITRIILFLAIAALVNEIVRLLENADDESFGATLRKPLNSIQHLFTLEPSGQMIEVALCAYNAVSEAGISGANDEDDEDDEDDDFDDDDYDDIDDDESDDENDESEEEEDEE